MQNALAVTLTVCKQRIPILSKCVTVCFILTRVSLGIIHLNKAVAMSLYNISTTVLLPDFKHHLVVSSITWNVPGISWHRQAFHIAVVLLEMVFGLIHCIFVQGAAFGLQGSQAYETHKHLLWKIPQEIGNKGKAFPRWFRNVSHFPKQARNKILRLSTSVLMQCLVSPSTHLHDKSISPQQKTEVLQGFFLITDTPTRDLC